MWPMACSHFLSPTTTDVLLFGGNKQRKSNQEKHVMSDLTIFSFGEQTWVLIQLCTCCHHLCPLAPAGVLELRVLCLEAIRQHGLTDLVGTLPYVARNQFRTHTNAHFHHLSCAS